MNTSRLSDKYAIVSHSFTIEFIRIKSAQLCPRSDFSLSDDDDLRQEMLLYLRKKAHLFDPTRGNIEAFVTMAIKSWIGMELRHRARLKRCGDYRAISIERTIIRCDGDAVPLRTVLRESDLTRRTRATTSDPFEQVELQDSMANLMAQLTPRQRDLVDHVAEHGIASAARRRHVSRRQIENEIAQMRARFEDPRLRGD